MQYILLSVISLCLSAYHSVANLLSVISLCLSAVSFCGFLYWILVQLIVRRLIRNRVRQDHLENIENVYSSYSMGNNDEEISL